MSEYQNLQIVNNVKLSNCQNVRMSKSPNCQQCKIVKMSKCQNVRMSECQNVRMSKCQIVNQIVKLSQYQMSFIIRVCRLTQRIDCVLIFSIFSNKPGPTFNSSSNFFPPFSLSLPPLLVARMPDALQWKCREENASSSLTAKV